MWVRLRRRATTDTIAGTWRNPATAAGPWPTSRTMTRLPRFSAVLLTLGACAALAACGDGGGGGGDGGNGDGDGGATVDADPNAVIDGMLPPGCDNPGTTQCSDCIDNDQDGTIDGFDIECISAADDDEGSFETGIPGDNMDGTWQDCFFDGNSGGGNGDCRYNTCCMYPPSDDRYCTDAGDLASCDVLSQDGCVENCGPAAPPGCDCFGCCTICGDQGCVDIITNPAIAPDCDGSNIYDETACPRCVPNADCGTECDANPDDCVLCPGEDESDLPPGCVDQSCPEGQEVCDAATPCPAGDFCSNGCCIPEVVID